jgi:hypothetical protein
MTLNTNLIVKYLRGINQNEVTLSLAEIEGLIMIPCSTQQKVNGHSGVIVAKTHSI